MKNIAMRFLLFSVLSCAVFSVGAFAEEKVEPAAAKTAPANKVVIGYFSQESQEDFEKKVKPAFEQFKGSCKNCEITNLTPYDEKGNYAEKLLVEAFKNSPEEVSIFFFSWNKRATDQNKELVPLLGEQSAKGRLVVAPTGHAAEGEAGLALSRTVMGQVKDVVIIGEITGNERMLPQSYFGPEMMTAIRAPKDFLGQGGGPLYFASRLAGVWSKRTATDWIQHFRTKKERSRKIWLDTYDLLK